jgi:hypothetical protein
MLLVLLMFKRGRRRELIGLSLMMKAGPVGQKATDSRNQC